MNVYYILSAFGLLSTLSTVLLWRKISMTSSDLVSVANALSNSAAALATASNGIVTLIAQLKSSGGLIDQGTLDTVITTLQSAQTSVDASVSTLKNLLPAS